jgi:hypothetical protein
MYASKNLTIKEFSEEIKVSLRYAYGMARSDEFRKLRISVDIGIKKSGRKNANWRIDMQRYYDARERGII